MTRRDAAPVPPVRVPRGLAVCVLIAAASTAPLLATTAQDLYTAALADEREMRAPADTPPTLVDLRAGVAAYLEVVRQFPRSGYSDNALWQAAGLSIQAFDRHRQVADRAEGVKLLRMLATEYPSSSLAARVAGRLEQFHRLDGPVQIRDIRRVALDDVVRVTIELDDEVAYDAVRLDGPARLFFDFKGAYAPPPLLDATLAFDDGDAVREIRLGRHPEQTTRVVLDLEDVDSYSVYSLYTPYRLVVDVVPTAVMQARRASPEPSPLDAAAGEPGPSLTEPRDDPSPVDPGVMAEAVALADPVQRDEPGAGWPGPPAWVEQPRAEATDVARPDPSSLLPVPEGWEARRLDAILPTAIDVAGVVSTPQTVVAPPAGPRFLAASRAVVPPLPQAGQTVRLVEVVHAQPVWSASVPLRTREPVAPVALVSAALPPTTGTAAANADGNFSLSRQLGLGVSRIVIDPGHGGYDPGARTGDLTESELVLDVATRLEALLAAETDIEVILTRRSDAYLPLRARTDLANQVGADLFLSIHANAAGDRTVRGVETYFLDLATDPTAQTVAARENAASREGMHDLQSLVQSITLHNKLDESRDLAEMVQRHLIGAVRELYPGAQNLGVKQAPFVVLIGAEMPSVLAEISFVTNQEDAAYLATDAYREQIANAFLQSILEYQRALKPVTFAAGNNN